MESDPNGSVWCPGESHPHDKTRGYAQFEQGGTPNFTEKVPLARSTTSKYEIRIFFQVTSIKTRLFCKTGCREGEGQTVIVTTAFINDMA